MTEPREPDTFYIAPAYSDSTGRSAIPHNALFVGSRSAVMERILDSKARRTALSIINDAEHARGTLQAIRERERDVAAREDAVNELEDEIRHTLLADFIGKLDALAARINSFEAKANHDPDDDLLPTPPSTPDDGDLQSPTVPPKAHDPNDEPDPDVLDDLPLPPEDQKPVKAAEDQNAMR